MTRLIRTTCALIGGFSLMLSAVDASAVVYVYELSNGTRIVTDHVLSGNQYRLVHTSQSIKGIGAVMRHQNPQALLVDVDGYDDIIASNARLYGVDPALVKAVIHTESGFNPHAVSNKGASGLMQLMPATAAHYGVNDVFDPKQNVRGGVLHLRRLLRKYKNNVRLALAAYNAGEEAVSRYKGVPPYKETRGYVVKVARYKKRYAPAWNKSTGRRTVLATAGR